MSEHKYLDQGSFQVCLTHNRVCAIDAECPETRPDAVYSGYTRDELSEAFDQVKNPGDWKLPIDATVPADADRDCISAAVAFFTGSPAAFAAGPRAGRWRVTAAGYYACIGS